MKKLIVSILMLAVLFSPINVFANEKPEMIKKTYVIEGKIKKPFAKEIKKDGDRYKLKDTKYNFEKFTTESSEKVADESMLSKEITKNVNDKEYKFYLKKINSKKEIPQNINILEEKEYLTRDQVPSSINKDGYELSLAGVRTGSRWENFTAPAKFYTYDTDGTEYYFNGKKVSINGTPKWSGYETDVANYLGLNNSQYKVTGGEFTSDFVKSSVSDGLFERTAQYTGNKKVNFYIATYKYSGADKNKKMFDVKATYESDNLYKVKATAEYKKKSFNFTFVDGAILGGIILILGLIIAFLRRRRKSDDK